MLRSQGKILDIPKAYQGIIQPLLSHGDLSIEQDYFKILNATSNDPKVTQWINALTKLCDVPPKFNKEQFIECIKNKDYENAKALHKYVKANLHEKEEEIFLELCSIGDIESIKWFYKYCKKIGSPVNLRAREDAALKLACYTCYNKKLIKWLLRTADLSGDSFDIHVGDDEIFDVLCAENKMDMLIWWIDYCQEIGDPINLNNDDNYPFRISCSSGYANQTRYLLEKSIEIGQHIDIHANEDEAFKASLKNKQFDLSELIINLGKRWNVPINIHKNNIFEDVAAYGEIESIQWLISYGEQINYPITEKELNDGFTQSFANCHETASNFIMKYMDDHGMNYDVKDAFSKSSEKGDVLAAERLLLIAGDDFNIHHSNEKYLRLACHYGKLEFVVWLISKFPDIDIHANNESAFRIACRERQYDICQFLWNLSQDINLGADDHYCFKIACQNFHVEMANWIETLHPCYEIQRTEDRLIPNIKQAYEVAKDLIHTNYKKALQILFIGSKKNVLDEDDFMCPICNDPDIQNVLELPCKHYYCFSCLLELNKSNWGNNKCQACFKNFKWENCMNIKKN